MSDGYGFEFRFQYEKGGREVIVRDGNRDANLNDIVDSFEAFLKAVGYNLPGSLEFEKSEKP